MPQMLPPGGREKNVCAISFVSVASGMVVVIADETRMVVAMAHRTGMVIVIVKVKVKVIVMVMIVLVTEIVVMAHETGIVTVIVIGKSNSDINSNNSNSHSNSNSKSVCAWWQKVVMILIVTEIVVMAHEIDKVRVTASVPGGRRW